MDTKPMRKATDHSNQAESWFQRMNAPDCTECERAQFERWRSAHPAHADAYARTAHLYRRAALLRLAPTWREAARRAREQTAPAVRRRRWRRIAGAAAVVLVLCAAWWRWAPAPFERQFATTVGERRTIALPDGSQVVLDTDTAIDVRYTLRHRDVALERGQAQFSVAKAPARPFVVRAGAGAVRAVGTQFQVRKDDATVLVTLLEGVVTVQADEQGHKRTATLAAGDQLRFDDGALWARQPANLAAAQGWTRGELIFDHRPLAEVLAEMNRYGAVKIRLGDPSLAPMPVTGAFYDNDPSSLIQALEQGWHLRADRVSAQAIVLRRIPRRGGR